MTRETPGAPVGDDEHRAYGRVPLTEVPPVEVRLAEVRLAEVPTGHHPAAEVTARPTHSGRADGSTDGSTAIAYDTPDHVPAGCGRPLLPPSLRPLLPPSPHPLPHPPLHLLTHDGGS
ncbi:hypothetical protein [Streptomyces hyaluromycini]|uniref:hypothetical protein n=1 Tax=Streptomyces hyaluromycini TaxID=1377993 RepID=UPI000B5CE3BC|nr:hypothetical protein [Streptomyces hyaluromycini]